MSLSNILNTARSGLAASQASMQVVSNNVANAGTAGYARERVATTSGSISGRVSGVMVGEASRVADKFLESAVYTRASDAGWSEAAASYLGRLESLLGTTGSATSLSARLNALTASATQLTGLPMSAATIATFTNGVDDAVQLLGQLRGDASQLQANADTEIGNTVDRSNQLLAQIHDLNSQIAERRAAGQSFSGAENARTGALEELSSLMKVTAREQPDGRVTIDNGNGQVLLDRRLRQLSYPMGAGASQAVYQSIDIRFANPDGSIGASTGDRIESSAVGGRLGALIDLRDNALPGFSRQVATVFAAMAETLNKASNLGTSVPAPEVLSGAQTGMLETDRLGFTGVAHFAVTARDGTLLARTTLDFDALGPAATMADALSAINAGLGGRATASLVDGRLTISATDSSTGIVVAQDETSPSNRAGTGFSQFFGLNDLVVSDRGAVRPSGFGAGDALAFGAGDTAQFVLRDAAGRQLASYGFTATGTESYGDLVTALNASPLGGFGTFAIDSRGRLELQPNSDSLGATLSVPVDSTSRGGTGVSLSDITGLAGARMLDGASINGRIGDNPGSLQLARLQLDAVVGSKALGAGDVRGATAFADALIATVDMGASGKASFDVIANGLTASVASRVSGAQSALSSAQARFTDAVSRRDNFAGVNVDEELATMVVLQNSYSASARVMSAASDMYDTLIAMID